MKNLIILWITFINISICSAQFGPPNLVADNIDFITNVYPADIDGDGFIDIVATSRLDHRITWHRNLDGLGTFDNTNVISDVATQVRMAIAEDVDNDGDLDILATLSEANQVVWYENLDGQGTFGTHNVINNNSMEPQFIHAVDFNNDGYNDVLFTARDDDKVAWHENINGTGVYGPENIISLVTPIPTGLASGDIDGDGDMDAVVSAHGDYEVVWYENLDGEGTFGAANLVQIQYNAGSIDTADLDGDGDLDILYTLSQVIGWHENLDGEGNFGSRNDIGYGTGGIDEVTTADIDNDGDMDVLVYSSYEDAIALFENLNGAGTFSAAQFIVLNLDCQRDIVTADLNGDNKLDVVGTNGCADKVFWYENGVPTDPNPNLFNTWYIISIDTVWGDFVVDEIVPSIDPYLIISEDLSFTGYAACNSYEGTFDIPSGESWISTSFSTSPEHCDIQILKNFEYAYFDFIQESGYYSINSVSDGLELTLTRANGDEAIYRNFILSTPDTETDLFSIVPNPVSDTFRVDIPETLNLVSVEILDIHGRTVEYSAGSESMNISAYPSGIYFVRISTSEGKQIQKLIKN